MSRWVLIDAGFLGHRALHSTGHLAHDGEPTGVVLGFLLALRRVCEDPRVRSNQVALFFDSRHSLRRDAFPGYKRRRREDRSEEERELVRGLHRQLRRLREELLPELGLPVFLQRGLESDDLLAEAATSLSGRGEAGVLVTADSDLWQSITHWVHWFDPVRDRYHTPESFKREKGLDPRDWWRVKVLAGDKTDEVPGIRGVGEKTAVKFLLDDLGPRSLGLRRIRAQEAEATARNEPLVKLPHAMTRPVFLQGLRPRWDLGALRRAFRDLHAQTQLQGKVWHSWERFCLEGPRDPTHGVKLRRVK